MYVVHTWYSRYRPAHVCAWAKAIRATSSVHQQADDSSMIVVTAHVCSLLFSCEEREARDELDNHERTRVHRFWGERAWERSEP